MDHRFPPSRRSRRPLGRTLLLLGLLVPIVAAPVAGQASEVREQAVYFKDGSDSRDGYGRASVPFRYQFRVCTDEIQILYFADLVGLATSGGYWYKGHLVPDELRERFPPVPPGSIPVRGSIRSGYAGVANFEDGAVLGSQIQGCLGQAHRVGLIRDLVGDRPSRAQLQSYLDGLYLQLEGAGQTLPYALRNPALERAMDERDRTAGRPATDTGAAAAGGAAAAKVPGGTGADRRSARHDGAKNDESSGPSLTFLALEAMNAAQQAERSGDKARAARLYTDIANGRAVGLFTPEQVLFARRKSTQLSGQLMGDAGVQGLAAAANAEGVGAGLLYGRGYFNGSFLTGATIGTARGTRLQYFDIAIGSGLVSDWLNATDTLDVAADTSERAQFMFRLGSTLPKLRMTVGRGQFLAPHFSYTMYITDAHRLDLLTTGLVFWTRGSTYIRLDAMIVSGSPQYGFAVGL